MSNLLLCFRNVRRSLADSRGVTQMEFWTKWSDVRNIEFSHCNTTGNSRAMIKLEKESLYLFLQNESNLSNQLKKAHLHHNRPIILYIDEDAIHHTNL